MSLIQKIKNYTAKGLTFTLLAGGAFGLWNIVTSDLKTHVNKELKANPTMIFNEKYIQKTIKEYGKDQYNKLLLTALCFGTLGLLGVHYQNRKIKKQTLKPSTITEVISLPIDTILKYRWTASILAGITALSQLQPDQENMKFIFGQNHTIYNSLRIGVGAYGIIPMGKLFLDQMAIFKKPFLASFPKAGVYSISGWGSNKFHKKALEQIEDCLEKRIEVQTTNIETDEDRACYNLTKLLEEKINDHSNFDIFTKIARTLLSKVEGYQIKRTIKNHPEKTLSALINLQQNSLLLNNKKKTLQISKRIITECQKHEDPLPILINQAKILEYYNQNNPDIWKKAILTLIRKYNFKNDCREKGGSQSEVLEIKKEATISGANTLIIERSNNKNKINKVYKISKYLSGILDITPIPLEFLDISKMSKNSDEFSKKYYLFMERKPGFPIDLNDTNFLEKNVHSLLEMLAEYQIKATQNLEKIKVSIPVMDCEKYFKEKFLDRIKVDPAICYLFQKGIEPVIDYLQHQKPYFNHFNLHEKNILQNGKTITGLIDNEDAVLTNFGIDLGFLANYLKFRDQVVQPYYTIFGKKQGISKKEFAKEAYSAMVLATAGLVGRNIAYKEGREYEFMLNLHNFAEKLPIYYPQHTKEIKMFRKALDHVLV